MEFSQKCLDLLFPPDIKCILCKQELSNSNNFTLCKSCMGKLPWIDENICNKCGAPIKGEGSFCLHCLNNSRAFDKNFSIFKYEYPMIKFIQDLKFKNKKYLANCLSAFLLKKYEEIVKNFEIDVIIPIPLHKEREKERGFNQVNLLLKNFSNYKNKIDINNLVRIKNTYNQIYLTRKEREENMTNAFTIKEKSKVKNKNILLVDDVFTTGNTMEEGARTLRKYGAKKVYSLTLAHAWSDLPHIEDEELLDM